MQPAFTTTPLAEDMVIEDDHGDHALDNKWLKGNYCLGILILCVSCEWTGHFCDGSTDHFFNHKCKLRTQSISEKDL